MTNMPRSAGRAVLRLVFAGPYVSVQDGGRRGFMRYGVPHSGPMDRLGFAAANLALGNQPGATQIEVSVGGLTLECVEGEVAFAVAGGGFLTALDGDRGDSWRVDVLRKGARLVIRPGRWGAWTNLAFAGRLIVPEWLGSTATHALSGLGGGRLTTGQMLEIEAPRIVQPQELPCPVLARPRRMAHVIMGPQDHCFPARARAAFLDSIWQLTNAYDRMGMRLAGPLIAPEARLDMPSEGIMRGAVQVAGDGVPVVLQADHQTTGGYPKIATLLDAEADRFAQGRPGDRIRFRSVTPAEATIIARNHHDTAQRYLAGIRRRGI